MKKNFDFKNWWYYHKWYVIVAIICIGILGSIIQNKFHIGETIPDYQIAYIGSPLPEETVAAIEDAFAAVSSDLNGDGEISVQLNQYLSEDAVSQSDSEAGNTLLAAEISIIGDIEDCDSYFFLIENPDTFQSAYGILANPDGSCPSENDKDTESKVIPWSESVFADDDLGEYSMISLGTTVTGDSQDLLANYYIGQRCFYTEKTSANAEECQQLWTTLRRIP